MSGREKVVENEWKERRAFDIIEEKSGYDIYGDMYLSSQAAKDRRI
jgi:rubrerythrin